MRAMLIACARSGTRAVSASLISVGALLNLAAPLVAQERPRESRGAAASRLQYPHTRRDTTAEIHHGVRVEDPYRWLEDLASADTRAWVDAQQKLTDSVLAGLPDRDAILARLRELQALRPPPGPAVIGGRTFVMRSEPGKTLRLLHATEDGQTAGTLLFDPSTVLLRGNEVFSRLSPAPDNRHVSYYVSQSGRDYGELRIRNVESGRDLADTLRGMRQPATLWLNGHALLYTRNEAADTGGTQATSTGRQLAFHALGTNQRADRLLYAADRPGAWIRLSAASNDGRFAAFIERTGMIDDGVFVVDLTNTDRGSPEIRRLLGPGRHEPIGFVGDTLFVRTQDGAPNWRILALDVRGKQAPRTVVPEGSEPMEAAVLTADRIVVQVARDVVSRVLLYTHRASLLGDVPLPAAGNVMGIMAHPSSRALFFQVTSTLIPRTTYRYDADVGRSIPLHSTPGIDVSAFETRQVFFRSKDGTRVPMFLTMRRDAKRDGATPVLIDAYGGFGFSMKPAFLPYVMTWLELGGAYALVNVRGGGEYGAPWHQQAVGARKQKVFDDVSAAAEFLVRERYSTRDRVVLYGESNGGLTMGAVMVQRPDLVGVALPLSGVHDMLRYHLFTVGRNWASETGTAEDSELFPYILAYSPLHNVRRGTCYPATLVMAAADDDRVVPSHSYKFAAALQAAQACDRPVLLHVSRGASHLNDAAGAALAQTADMLTFAANHVGLRAPATWKR